HCPYQHHLAERGLAEAFQQDYARRSHELCADDSVLPLDAFHDAFIGERACEFLETIPAEAPWHYFVSFVGPHNPWDAPKEYSARYNVEKMPAERAIRDSLDGKPLRQKQRQALHDRRLDTSLLRRIWRQYAGAITLIDDYVGRFVDILRRRGLLENTVVFYTSDHGEMMGDRGMFAKSLYYEATLRVPLIAAGPGVSAADPQELNNLAKSDSRRAEAMRAQLHERLSRPDAF
ncbi:MAG: sulfatase-like hydrolase/transferase, partial [Candidatus Sumerlaeota bacterium]|nr:sulfatase-like hydrolase/transferase [Candidatus Sumerlaeota bacterium]